ncbi:GtrA family protein [Sphingopyxis alaskensis]|jgi:putative flippase GtrA|uniref:GtrA-like protein n=1 Tax=Sphingopyxis alaskensis (strain DSM 13593 / LMG 18877 / RB2256) TaxID=317655 RepID=Q1GP55_SPHAL|nr:GtrA family protein [Sphingopyxis alaskensis]ABF54567.1 GtrA-like protein [Sphingopyxis alaskensis RB2256]MCM3421014.1 GtrA family protein [Sphingopyxis alaskensis]
MQSMLKLIALVRRREGRWLNYLLASALALGSDAGLFLLLLDAGLGPVPASATGYCAGILVHWVISSRLVFADGAAARGTGERHRQKLLFVGSALVGLGVTTAIVGGGSALGIDPRLAKLAAIVVSFQTTYLLRRHIVFRAASA